VIENGDRHQGRRDGDRGCVVFDSNLDVKLK